MYRLTRSLMAIAIIFATFSVQAQNPIRITIEGRVVDYDVQPLVRATVRFMDDQFNVFQVVTDGTGFYQFKLDVVSVPDLIAWLPAQDGIDEGVVLPFPTAPAVVTDPQVHNVQGFFQAGRIEAPPDESIYFGKSTGQNTWLDNNFFAPSSAATEPCDTPMIRESVPDAIIPAGVTYTGPALNVDVVNSGDGQPGQETVRWTLIHGPLDMAINPTSGVVIWANPDPALKQVTITIEAQTSCATDRETWTLVIDSHPPTDCQPQTELEFDFQDNRTGDWTDVISLGSPLIGPTPFGLCIWVPEQGNNIAQWFSPERTIELKDFTAYKVEMKMGTDQRGFSRIPLWALNYDNYNSSDFGSIYGGTSWFLDVAGGANGIGRENGRDTFVTWLLPNSAMLPQWRGLIDDGSIGAFDPSVDEFNDMRLSFQVLDVGDANFNANVDWGNICINSINVQSVGLECLGIDEVLYNASINSEKFLPAFVDGVPPNFTFDDARGSVRFDLDTDFDHGSLIPFDQSLDPAALFPVVWESDTLYRVAITIQSAEGSSEIDPVDVLMVNMTTATNELGSVNYTTRGSQSGVFNNMFRSASPRLESTAGGPQTYIALFHGNNVTEGTNPGDARLRPMLDLFNTESLFGMGTGGDPLEVLNIEVSRLKGLQ